MTIDQFAAADIVTMQRNADRCEPLAFCKVHKAVIVTIG